MNRTVFSGAAGIWLLIFSGNAQAANPYDAIPAQDYTLDKSHASLTFTVNHMGFSHYTAGFDDFDAVLKLDPKNPALSDVSATINPLSLDLPSPPPGFIDAMMGGNWFNAAVHPSIKFTSDKIEITGKNTGLIHGTLELLGVKKPIVLKTVFNGGTPDNPMDRKARVGFSATASFNRSDFGMTYGIPKLGTNVGVGDKVDVMIEAEFTGKPAAGYISR